MRYFPLLGVEYRMCGIWGLCDICSILRYNRIVVLRYLRYFRYLRYTADAVMRYLRYLRYFSKLSNYFEKILCILHNKTENNKILHDNLRKSCKPPILIKIKWILRA